LKKEINFILIKRNSHFTPLKNQNILFYSLHFIQRNRGFRSHIEISLQRTKLANHQKKKKKKKGKEKNISVTLYRLTARLAKLLQQ
jgi:hypothetical protein